MKLVKNDDGSWRSWDSLRDDCTDKVETIDVVPVERLKELGQYLVRSIMEEQGNANKGITSSNRVVAALRMALTQLNSLMNSVGDIERTRKKC